MRQFSLTVSNLRFRKPKEELVESIPKCPNYSVAAIASSSSTWEGIVTHQSNYKSEGVHRWLSPNFASGKLSIGGWEGDCQTVYTTHNKGTDQWKIVYEYSGDALHSPAEYREFATRFGTTAPDFVKVVLFFSFTAEEATEAMKTAARKAGDMICSAPGTALGTRNRSDVFNSSSATFTIEADGRSFGVD